MAVTFYADFACPYCYAEAELINQLGVAHLVSFKPVSLLPKAPVPWDPDDELVTRIMHAGWESFVERTPGLEANQPAGLPNTRLAAQAMAEVLSCAPGRAPELRRELYRALWVDGLDLGVPEVLLGLWNGLGLPRREKLSRDSRLTAQIWQNEWLNGPFEQRVPVIARPDGARLLGHPTEEELRDFLADPNAVGSHSTEVCRN